MRLLLPLLLAACSDEPCEFPQDAGPDLGEDCTPLPADDGPYRWIVVEGPAGGQIAQPSGPAPCFAALVPGAYTLGREGCEGVLDLIVIDVPAENLAPIADAAAVDAPILGQVALDARGSRDPDGEVVGYAWSVASAPAGATWTIDDPSAAVAHLTGDVAGDWVVAVTVTDDAGATSPPDFADWTLRP